MFNTPYLAKPDLASVVAAAQALFDKLKSSWHGVTSTWAGVREAIPHVAEATVNAIAHHMPFGSKLQLGEAISKIIGGWKSVRWQLAAALVLVIVMGCYSGFMLGLVIGSVGIMAL